MASLSARHSPRPGQLPPDLPPCPEAPMGRCPLWWPSPGGPRPQERRAHRALGAGARETGAQSPGLGWIPGPPGVQRRGRPGRLGRSGRGLALGALAKHPGRHLLPLTRRPWCEDLSGGCPGQPPLVARRSRGLRGRGPCGHPLVGQQVQQVRHLGCGAGSPARSSEFWGRSSRAEDMAGRRGQGPSQRDPQHLPVRLVQGRRLRGIR